MGTLNHFIVNLLLNAPVKVFRIFWILVGQVIYETWWL